MKLLSKVLVCLSATGLLLVSCKAEQSQPTLLAYDNMKGDIFVSLAHPYDRPNDDFEVVVSTASNVDSLTVCEVDVETGTCGVEETSRLIFANDDRNFFVADKSALLEHDLTIALVAKDKSGNIVDMRTFSYYNNEDPTAGSGGRGLKQGGFNSSDIGGGSNSAGSASQQSTSPNTASLERNNCSVAGCHNNYNQFSAAQKGDALSSGRMPRGRTITAEDKAALLEYFNGG